MLMNAGGIDVPTNEGLFAPVTTVFREGSLLNPRFPASSIFGNQMCDEVLESIMLALADALPDRVTAGWNQLLCTALAGVDPRTQAAVGLALDLHARRPRRDEGRRRLRRARLHRALPARCALPTWRCSSSRRRTSWSSTSTCPTRPVRGEWRGGLGTVSRWRFYGVDELGVTIGDDAASEGADPAPGLFGGEPAGLNELRLHYPDGTVKDWGSKEIVFGIPEGTICEALQRGRRRLRRPAPPRRTESLGGGARRAASRRRRRARATASRSCPDGTGSTRPRRHGSRGMSYRVGIDVGGTFTDFLVLGADGTRLVHKTSSTPGDPSLGLVTGLEEIASRAGRPLAEFLAEVELIVHGTTVTTNALLTRRGARTGLLCTEGFRDALALRQGTREAPYDNRLQPPEPLVPRYLRLGVAERIDYEGDEVTPLDDEERARGLPAPARRRASRRSRSASCTRRPNPAHERRARRALPRADARRLRDGRRATCSRRSRYYDRTSTTVAQRVRRADHHALPGGARAPPRRARLRRRAAGDAVERRRRDARRGRPSAPRSRCSRARPRARPPASGSWRRTASTNCITIDMGGTSFDAALVKRRRAARHDRRGRRPLARSRCRRSTSTRSAPAAARSRASTPAGCCASARRARAPRPGRRATAAAATQPTVTDADLVLGFIDPRRLPRRRDAARPRGRRAGDREPRRRAARHRSRRGGGRHLRRRQRRDGDRRPRGECPPRARSARLPAGGGRRRRARACRRDRGRARDPDAARPARVVDLLRRRAC